MRVRLHRWPGSALDESLLKDPSRYRPSTSVTATHLLSLTLWNQLRSNRRQSAALEMGWNSAFGFLSVRQRCALLPPALWAEPGTCVGSTGW